VSLGVEPTGEEIAFSFGGKTIRTLTGQSLLAALIAAGEKICRVSAAGAGRGMFCGMGVCQECIVEIEGAGSQRACMTIAQDGMVVRPAEARPESVAAMAEPRLTHFAPDVLVVGGGAAGLGCAAVAAEAGLAVLIVDERAKLGGQFYKQPADGFRIEEPLLDGQFRGGRALIRRVAASGALCLSSMTVAAVFGAEEIVATGEDAAAVIRPKRLVLATGAYERGVPMPGWTLPGFMTTGAAQTLLRSYQLGPGRRVLVAGNGPLNLQVAVELTRAGVEVVGLAEIASRPGPGSLASLTRMFASAPDLVRDGLSYRMALRRAGIPIFHRHAVIRAEGRGEVERAVIAAIDAGGHPISGSEKEFAVDVVCTGYGFLPANEIARALGCRHGFDAGLGQLVAERDAEGRSSVPHVHIVGDCGGMGGARLAQAQGVIAGAAIARELGRAPRDPGEIAAAEQASARAKRFQAALWRLYRAPRMLDQLASPDTILCRCEEIPLASVERAFESDIASAGAVKRITRAGMGRCQGRYCGALMVELLARRRGVPVDEFSFFAPRLPFKPVPAGILSALEPRVASQTSS
jgi:NADPH-dependent 2,4-dienoyl-CoA reductase/sulfur reductase-like enzyme